MRDAIEDLHALADECREWAKPGFRPDEPFNPDPAAVQQEFKRLADKLDTIAKQIAPPDQDWNELNLAFGFAIGQLSRAHITPDTFILGYLKKRGIIVE
jgi:hypothetical protein